MINKISDLKLAIIGLGYVGLPLALEFSKIKPVIGFDNNKKRIFQLNSGIDKNFEYDKNLLKKYKKLKFTNKKQDLTLANCFIVTVPTPVDKFKRPNLKPLLNASELIGKILKKGDLIIYESTVYPGCIEEDCVPTLEKFSKLKFNKDFFCGYSPERINPGDKKHTISSIKKVVAGSTPEITNLVNNLYKKIISAGTFKAPSIKVAEAAKIIENTQRDLNIALINELSIIFDKMNIDTEEVLKAAKTKWNFLPFMPGLVGGHCIGVDPYYLTHQSKKIGYNPKIILSGREINDNMGSYVVSKLIKKMKEKNISIKNSKILVMGLTFKENCADVRNSGVENVIKNLKKLNCEIDLYDPWADRREIKNIYDIYPVKKLKENSYQGIIIAVRHRNFKDMGIKAIKRLCKTNHVIYDLKYLFLKNQVDLRL
jgi:UDP-N-acetyl-D-galactosamine dehydrogenase